MDIGGGKGECSGETLVLDLDRDIQNRVPEQNRNLSKKRIGIAKRLCSGETLVLDLDRKSERSEQNRRGDRWEIKGEQKGECSGSEI